MRKRGRPRTQERVRPYIDLKKACDIYLNKNPDLKSFSLADLHKLYLKKNPKNYVSYQTFVNWRKKGFDQISAFDSIAKIVGLDSFSELITRP
jgi:hypothetical protein